MSPTRDDLIQYRLGRAREALEDARLMAHVGHWNTCANRLYYACFYAVSALLCRHGLGSSKHSGVRALFNQHFAKPGLIALDLADFYNDLFDTRHEADYEDLVQLTADDVQPWIGEVEELIEQVSRLALVRTDPDQP